VARVELHGHRRDPPHHVIPFLLDLALDIAYDVVEAVIGQFEQGAEGVESTPGPAIGLYGGGTFVVIPSSTPSKPIVLCRFGPVGSRPLGVPASTL
jgi:hypothetical protein